MKTPRAHAATLGHTLSLTFLPGSSIKRTQPKVHENLGCMASCLAVKIFPSTDTSWEPKTQPPNCSYSFCGCMIYKSSVIRGFHRSYSHGDRSEAAAYHMREFHETLMEVPVSGTSRASSFPRAAKRLYQNFLIAVSVYVDVRSTTWDVTRTSQGRDDGSVCA